MSDRNNRVRVKTNDLVKVNRLYKSLQEEWSKSKRDFKASVYTKIKKRMPGMRYIRRKLGKKGKAVRHSYGVPLAPGCKDSPWLWVNVDCAVQPTGVDQTTGRKTFGWVPVGAYVVMDEEVHALLKDLPEVCWVSAMAMYQMRKRLDVGVKETIEGSYNEEDSFHSCRVYHVRRAINGTTYQFHSEDKEEIDLFLFYISRVESLKKRLKVLEIVKVDRIGRVCTSTGDDLYIDDAMTLDRAMQSMTDCDWRPAETVPEDYYAL